jgi:hypothetical protein
MSPSGSNARGYPRLPAVAIMRASAAMGKQRRSAAK